MSDFWYSIEDFISRMKKDLSVTKAVRLVELYQRLGLGSQVFWADLETFLLIHSS